MKQPRSSYAPLIPSKQLRATPTITRDPIATSTPTSFVSASSDQVQSTRREFGIAEGKELIDFSQSELDGYFSKLKALGVTWIRWDMNWDGIQEYNSHTYDWKGADRVVATSQKYGINTLAVIAYSPKWARGDNCHEDFGCEPADPGEFGRFAGIAASRYKNTIQNWEIWNEQNHSTFWKPKPNFQNYSAILATSYTEIKKSNPNAVVITGGLAITGADPQNISPAEFVRNLYNSDSDKYFDAIALHPYSYPAAPNYQATWASWQQLEEIRQIMIEEGDSHKRIWITEYGVPTGGPGTARLLNDFSFNYGADYMPESVQAEMITQLTNLYSNNRTWMGPLFWYNLQDDGTAQDTPENFFGLLRFDGSKKPGYEVLRSIIFSGE